MKTILLAVTAALAIASGMYFLSNSTGSRMLSKTSEIDNAWVAWKQFNGKTYGTSSDEAYRKQVFANNYQMVAESNADSENTFTLELNKFADLEKTEFAALYTGRKNVQAANTYSQGPVEYLDISDLPASWDWRTDKRGPVGDVVDQGMCGSCWAFSATAGLEGWNVLNGGNKFTKYAEQQIVDCSTVAPWNMGGCRGGLEIFAYRYAGSQGMMLESDYPYTAKDGTCKYDSTKVQRPNTTGGAVPANNSAQLKARIHKQPTSVAVEADRGAFQFYKSGVLNKKSCGTDTDHAILAVGYGTENGVDYYIVRNSWGTSWGDNGYIKIGAQADGPGICGIQKAPTYAI